MTELRPCSTCQRHVAITETTCPFCSAGLPAMAPRSIARVRLTRAAVFTSAALAASACGGKSKPDATTNTNTNTATVDAGTTAEPPDDIREPDHATPKPYGAPPARRRVV